MFSSINQFELNRNGVSTNQDFICLIDLLTQIRDFLNELGYLAFGRDMSVFRQTGAVNGNIILDSATRTMESIRFCCMNANFAYRLCFKVHCFASIGKKGSTRFSIKGFI